MPRLSLTGAGRGLARTAFQAGTGFAADLANAACRTCEAAVAAATHSTSGPGTLKVTVLILRDENGRPLSSPEQIAPALEFADRTLREYAGIRVRPLTVAVLDGPAPTHALDPRANRSLLLDQTLGRTAYYDEQMAAEPASGSVSDVVGRPITVFVVRDIEGRTTGCSLGVSADWVIVQASLFDPEQPRHYDETVLVHELAHACNLPHSRDRQNLMFPASSPPAALRGNRLNRMQAAVLSANRHVVPGIRTPAVAEAD